MKGKTVLHFMIVPSFFRFKSPPLQFVLLNVLSVSRCVMKLFVLIKTKVGRNRECLETNSYELSETSFYKEEGVRQIRRRIIYDTGCEEDRSYIEICDDNEGSCEEIELYSEEWYAYERQQQFKKYEESCFIPTEDDCKKIDNEMNQCVLDLTEEVSEFLCVPSSDNLWKYRRDGYEGMFIEYSPVFREDYPPPRKRVGPPRVFMD